jgi:asparagine synthase (glutamine-hydrolysing)
MLHATPESVHEDQPMIDREQGLVLTADARIDNRTELITALRWQDKPSTSITDTDLVLGSYRKWGTASPEHLVGAFAFAIWDSSNQRLFCARDQIGIKPFYYYFSHDLFVFGSEINSLLCVSDVPARVNELRIADYLAHVGEDEEYTFYQDIYRLPPAHSLTVTRDALNGPVRYWTLDASHEVKYRSDQEYEEHFLELFTEAVRCRVRAPSSPGVMVSGGLDSSSVTCVARDLLEDAGQSPLHAFTGTFSSLPKAELEKCDERSYIEALKEQGDLRVHEIPLDELSPLSDIESVVHHLGGPPFICNYYLHNATHQTARERGVRVVLDGSGGDDAVSHGFSLLEELAYAGRWDCLMEEATCLAHRTGAKTNQVVQSTTKKALRLRARRRPWRFITRDLARLKQDYGLDPLALFRQHVVKPRSPDALVKIWRSTQGRSLKPAEWRLLNDTFLTRVDYASRVSRLKSRWDVDNVDARMQHWLAIQAGAGITSIGLEEIDALAALGGVERRHPFFDIRLLQYCVGLAPEQKLRRGWTRSILRRAMQGILPDPIRKRSDKADLSPNFIRNVQKYEADRIEALFTTHVSRLKPYVDMGELRRAHDQRASVDLWHALTLAHWMQEVDEMSDKPDTPSSKRVQAMLAGL